MSAPSDEYRPAEIEPRWQARWEADRLNELDLECVASDEKLYNLVEFPYPSAEGLHVGHFYTYSGADAFGRFQRRQGRQVYQPIGFDAFGIHAENYALRVGEPPAALTARTVGNYRRQLRRMGAAWSWRSEVVTSDPAYYRWTQWIFLRLFEAGLAYRAAAPVVWCPSCLTVLANEQVETSPPSPSPASGEGSARSRRSLGVCERCRTPVTHRVMEQWFLRMTAYADRLLDGLEELDWPQAAKRQQREWIGRSRGVEIDFEVAETGQRLAAFTTRAETIFGVTFVAVAPEHPESARLAGLTAINPASGERVPIVVSEHVVATYAGGVVMGVPAHDERDRALALERGLPIRDVALADRERIVDWLEERGHGRRVTRYRLHDWLISRQRYWGPPIPIVHCPVDGPVAVPEADLPVLLPDVADVRPTGTGRSPLAAVGDFVDTACPRCGRAARRETDVSDNFVDSAWYFLRYPSTDCADRAWSAERTARLLPVDLYAGGREHVARHHLYARFVTHALYDLGLVPFAEPFPRLRLHGVILQGGAKMSKSRGNVVNPDDYVNRVGADNLRLYLLFCGDWQEGGDFSDAGLRGITRFTRRLWRLLTLPRAVGGVPGEAGGGGPAVAVNAVDMAPLDRAVERVGRDLERLKFNTAVAALMAASDWAADRRADMSDLEWTRTCRTLVLLLAPLAPHLAEELWSRLGGPYSVHQQPWPKPTAPQRTGEVTLVVQVSGRVRARLSVPAGLAEADAVERAMSAAGVARHLAGRPPTRVVYIPDRVLNLVVR
jgi:leucyl-tRNA synthetase